MIRGFPSIAANGRTNPAGKPKFFGQLNPIDTFQACGQARATGRWLCDIAITAFLNCISCSGQLCSD